MIRPVVAVCATLTCLGGFIAPSMILAEGAMPSVVGACSDSMVQEVGTRLVGTPGSGSAVSFTNGGSQVSYDQVEAVDRSSAGDPVRVCPTSVPEDCPPGDDRGRTYKTLNMRTDES